MILLLEGRPGAGKSTISAYFSEHWGALPVQTALCHTVIERCAPDDPSYWLLNDELKLRLASTDPAQLYVLERGPASTFGYLRAHDQLFGTTRSGAFDTWWVQKRNMLPTPDLVVHLSISHELSLRRRNRVEAENVWANARFLDLMDRYVREFLTQHVARELLVEIDAARDLSAIRAEIEKLLPIPLS